MKKFFVAFSAVIVIALVVGFSFPIKGFDKVELPNYSNYVTKIERSQFAVVKVTFKPEIKYVGLTSCTPLGMRTDYFSVNGEFVYNDCLNMAQLYDKDHKLISVIPVN